MSDYGLQFVSPPPNSVLKLDPQVCGWGVWVIGSWWGHKGGAPHGDQCRCKMKKRSEHSFHQVRIQQEHSHLQTRKRVSPDIRHVDIFTHLPVSRTVRSMCLLFKSPGLRQSVIADRTKTGEVLPGQLSITENTLGRESLDIFDMTCSRERRQMRQRTACPEGWLLGWNWHNEVQARSVLSFTQVRENQAWQFILRKIWNVWVEIYIWNRFSWPYL